MSTRWQVTDDITLTLRIIDAAGAGVTGASPTVQIRRHVDADGNLEDNFYWDGAAFVAAPTLIPLAEVDAVNNPGLYRYVFQQAGVAVARTYLMYFANTTDPVGFSTETHVVADDDAAVVTTLEDIKDGSTGNFDGATDSLTSFRDSTFTMLEDIKDGGTGDFDGVQDSLTRMRERIQGLLHENTIIDNQTYDGSKLLTARLRLFDSAVNVPAVGGEVVGKIGEYEISSQYDGQDRLALFLFKKVS